MQLDRRGFIGSATVALAAGGALWLRPGEALALGRDEAAEFVQGTINDVAALLETGSTTEKADRLSQIMQNRAAMPEIARFVVGPAWRTMSESQQSRFVEVFTRYVAGVYARRFEEYSDQAAQGDLFNLKEVMDAGRKGLLVRTNINRANEPSVAVDWLVTDRPGRTVISDIVIEGVSLLVTQREEIGSMLDARGGDVGQLIDHLASA